MPNNTPAVWNLPLQRNPFFTGRAQILDQLHRALTVSGKAALSGMGGAGKTQTAVEYAHLHRSEYSTVLWLKADTEDSLKTDYIVIAIELNLPKKDETDRDAVVSAVKSWLAGHSDWLLILDNADNLSFVSDLVRREWSGHILLTTRAYATGSISKVEIREMPVEEGTLFLLRRTKLIGIDDALESAREADQALAAEITQELGGLPLALDQAGAFIEERPSSFAEYLELYRREGDQLRAERGGLIIADHEPVTITFSLAFRQVESASAAAADMLRACAFLSPDAIPEEIFVTGVKELGENLAAMAGGGINLVKMIGEATRYSLIRRNTQNGTVEVHRVVQQVLKDEMNAKTRRLWAERVVRALNASFPHVEHKNWPLCEKLLSHAQEAAKLIVEHGFEFNEAARLLNQTGYYCERRAQYKEAEPLFFRGLSIREKVLGPEHPDVARSLNNLAALYDNQGKYAKAEPLYVRALSIREQVLGPEHPDVATSLNNLAILYKIQGEYAEAEPLFVRALRIFETAFGLEHPSSSLVRQNYNDLLEEMRDKTEE
jgi:tetratricopeptide (TPR) repeat protein